MTACNTWARFAEKKNKLRSICVNFALYWRFFIWDVLTAVAAVCFILFKVGFDLESLSMCMYAYLLYIIFSILAEAKILIWP